MFGHSINKNKELWQFITFLACVADSNIQKPGHGMFAINVDTEFVAHV